MSSVNVNYDGDSGMESEDSGSVGGGAAARIKALDKISASNIRNSQVITGVSGVVRELVENAIDAGGTSVQVLLIKHGLEKIEVRDNGSGIPAEDIQPIFQGGHTSKLKDTQNLTRGEHFGFKGEALHALCAAGRVSVTTKTYGESVARKYQLNMMGNVISQSKGALGGGTVITLEKLFEGIHVRRQRLQDKTTVGNELKDIETYLKGAALANPTCHLSLCHNGSLLWSKATVKTTEQAIVAVLGHAIGKKMEKFGPLQVNVNGSGSLSRNENESGLDRSVELYLPKKPVDMRTMSYTSNKMAMIFCNRKRVYIREFEKLIHKYVTASVVKPQPADQRRFPISILSITVPPIEADFNRDIDKTKVFLIHKDKILEIIEEALIAFYKVDLRNCDGKKPSEPSRSSNELDESNESMEFQISLQPSDESAKSTSILTSPTSERHDVIGSFLEDIPRITKAFSESPCKGNAMNVEPTSFDFPPVSRRLNQNEAPERRPAQSKVVSNFGISLSSQTLDEILTPQIQEVGGGPPKQIEDEAVGSNLTENRNLAQGIQKVSENKYQNWLEGRMLDENGEVIQNVISVSHPPISRQLNNEVLRAGTASGSFTDSRTRTFTCQAVYPTDQPPAKRQKLLDEVISRQVLPPATPPSASRYPATVPQSTPAATSTHKQIRLDSFPSWSSPSVSGGYFSRPAAPSPVTPTGIGLPLTPLAPRITPPAPSTRLFNNQSETSGDQAPFFSARSRCAMELNNSYDQPVQRQQQPLQNQHGRNDRQSVEPTKTPPSPPIKSRSKCYIDWSPYTDYCANMTNYELSPGIIAKLQGPSNVGRLYLVRTEDGIGVFSPENCIRSSGESSSSGESESTLNDPDGAGDLHDDDVTTLLSEYFARRSIHNDASPDNVYKTLCTSARLAEIVKEPQKMFECET